MQIFRRNNLILDQFHVTKNVCKNVAKTLIAKVQPAAIGQEQVVQKQKPVGVKKLAKFSLVRDLQVLIVCYRSCSSLYHGTQVRVENNGQWLVSWVFMCQNKMLRISQTLNTIVFVTQNRRGIFSIRTSFLSKTKFFLSQYGFHKKCELNPIGAGG